MIILTVEEIIELHRKLIAATGGSDGLRDRGLLESAVYSTQSGFGEDEIYPTVTEKAARLMYSLVNNHAFVDGNKRIGVYAMLITLRLNDITICFEQHELVELGLSAASGKADYEAILKWIKNHIK